VDTRRLTNIAVNESGQHAKQDPWNRMTVQPAPASRKVGQNHLPRTLTRLLHLQGWTVCGPTEQWLADVPPGRSRTSSGQARVTDVGDLRKAGEAKKWTLLISLIHTCRTD